MMPDANPYVGEGFVSKLRTCSRTALRQWHNARMCTHVRDERGPLGWALRSYRRRRDCHPLKPTWTGYRPGIFFAYLFATLAGIGAAVPFGLAVFRFSGGAF